MTDRAYIEKYSGRLIGLLLILLNYFWFKINAFGFENVLLDKSIDITGVLFGFLLATLALLIQGGNSALENIKQRDGLFKRLISFNKQVVIASLICLFVSFILVGTSNKWVGTLLIKDFLSSLFLGLHFWLLIDTILFTRIFYKIISQD